LILAAKSKAKQDAEPVEETAPEADSEVTRAEQETPDESPAERAEPEQDWQDRYLRLAAEFDNFRKRSAREFGDLIRSAERELIGELTDVLDNLDRALGTDHKGESVDEFARGVSLIREQLWTVMGKRGLERMTTVGEPFNPEAHDALMRMPSEEHEEGRVVQEVSPGYRLGDRVLKHAKVIVSQGDTKTNSENSDGAE